MAAAEITLFATGPMSSIIGNREKSSRNKQEVKTRFLGDDFSNLSSDVAKHLSENAVILAPGMDYGAANLRGAWLHVFLNTQNIVQTIAYSKFLSGGHNNLIDAIIIMNHEKCDVHYKHFWNYAPGWFENALMRDIIIDDLGNVFVAVSENGKLDPEKTFYKIYVRTLSDKLRHPLMQRPLMGLSASHGE